MAKGNKTRSQLILDALLTGKALPLSDIRRMVSEASGKEIRLQDTGSLLAKLINPRQYELAHLITRNKTPKGYEYSLVPEILALPPEEVYGLTRKSDGAGGEGLRAGAVLGNSRYKQEEYVFQRIGAGINSFLRLHHEKEIR